MTDLSDNPSLDEIRMLVLSSQDDVRTRFVQAFAADIDAGVSAISNAYRAYRHLDQVVEHSTRSAYVRAYVYSAFNSLISSFNLFLAGMQLPAGNLMRHYGEASAMALLCSHPGIDVLQRLEDEQDRFPFHKALEILNRRRNRELLGVHGPAWAAFMSLTSFYDRFSHASLFAVAANTMFDRPGFLAVVGEYDPEKAAAYKVELRRRRSGAEVLTLLTSTLASRLPHRVETPLTPPTNQE